MADQASGQNPSRYPDEQSLANSPTIAAIQQRVMALEADNSTRQQAEEPNNLVEAVRQGEWWLIGINAVLLIAQIVIACIYYGQLSQMRIATEASTRAANTAADTLEISSGDFERSLKLTIPQTVAQIKSAKAAEDAVNTTQTQMRLDQRAWVTVSVGESTGNFAISMRNTGRTRAIKVTYTASFAPGNRMGPPNVDLTKNSSSPIAPPKNAPPVFVEALKNGGFIRDKPPTGYVIAPGDSQIASDYQGKFTHIIKGPMTHAVECTFKVELPTMIPLEGIIKPTTATGLIPHLIL